jgi:hypothetical protein
MFPVKICGAWSLIYTTNNLFISNSKLQIDYNRLKFSPKEKFWGLDITKNIYGVIRINDSFNDSNTKMNHAKIVWMKSMDYEVDTHILPVINIPHKGMFCQTHITYSFDETLTIDDGIYQYVFIRDFSDKKNETFIRVFMTQLFLDYIIRHI